MAEYFKGLNYSLANEDGWIEYDLAPQNARSILCISGSGARALPFLAKNPATLDIADLSREQLWMAELRYKALKRLEYPEFLFFLGYRGGIGERGTQEDSRAALFKQLELTPECRAFWNANSSLWERRGFIYLGRWESHFMKLGKLLKLATRLDATPLFSAHTLAEQRELYKKHWHPKRFYGFLRLALSDFVFNRYLYKGHYAGGKDRRTVKEPTWEMVYRELTRRFTDTLLRKNFFMQMVFLGEVRHEEGFPPEANPAVFEHAKKSSSDVRFLNENFLSLTRARPYDFYSLSDTISYVSEQDARGFVANLHPETAPGSRILIRSFMRQPVIPIQQPWVEEPELAREARDRDCTGLYDFLSLRRT